MADYDVKFFLVIVVGYLLIGLPMICMSCETVMELDVTLDSKSMTSVTNIKK